MKSDNIAFLFPGQGLANFEILDLMSSDSDFSEKLCFALDFFDRNIINSFESRDISVLKINEVASILNVLASIFYLNSISDKNYPCFLAGYSVGQWTAIYASGSITFEQLIYIIFNRAKIMTECIKDSNSTMLAIIGIKESDLDKEISQIYQEGGYAQISNYNCMGQYSVSIKRGLIDQFTKRLQKYNPKKIIEIPVEGGWHSELLKQAENEFLRFLNDIEIKEFKTPVVDNVSGGLLPSDQLNLKYQLAKHISSPVLWEKGIRFLIRQGCNKFIEIGYGNTLTKFGFFIDRSLEHIAISC